jgi:hypothetical protein
MAETLQDLYGKLEKANVKLPDYNTFEKKYSVEGGADVLYGKLSSANVKLPDVNTFKSKYFSSTPIQKDVLVPAGRDENGYPLVTIKSAEKPVVAPVENQTPTNQIMKASLINSGVYDSPNYDEYTGIVAEQEARNRLKLFQEGSQQTRNQIANESKKTLTNYYEAKVKKETPQQSPYTSSIGTPISSPTIETKLEKEYQNELVNSVLDIDRETYRLNIADNVPEFKPDFNYVQTPEEIEKDAIKIYSIQESPTHQNIQDKQILRAELRTNPDAFLKAQEEGLNPQDLVMDDYEYSKAIYKGTDLKISVVKEQQKYLQQEIDKINERKSEIQTKINASESKEESDFYAKQLKEINDFSSTLSARKKQMLDHEVVLEKIKQDKGKQYSDYLKLSNERDLKFNLTEVGVLNDKFDPSLATSYRFLNQLYDWSTKLVTSGANVISDTLEGTKDEELDYLNDKSREILRKNVLGISEEGYASKAELLSNAPKFDKKGKYTGTEFQFNWYNLPFQTAKVSAESGILGIGGAVATSAFEGVKALQFLKYSQNLLGRGTYGLLKGTVQFSGMLPATYILFSQDMFENEMQKTGDPIFSKKVALARVAIETASELLNPLEINQFTSPSKLLTELSTEQAEKLSVKMFGSSKWAKAMQYMYFPKEFGKTWLEQGGKEYLEEFVSNVGNWAVDKSIKNGIIADENPDYKQENEISIENEVVTAINTIASMGLMAGTETVRSHKNAMNSAQFMVGANPELFKTRQQELLTKGKINAETFEKRTKEIDKISNIYNFSKGDIIEIDTELALAKEDISDLKPGQKTAIDSEISTYADNMKFTLFLNNKKIQENSEKIPDLIKKITLLGDKATNEEKQLDALREEMLTLTLQNQDIKNTTKEYINFFAEKYGSKIREANVVQETEPNPSVEEPTIESVVEEENTPVVEETQPEQEEVVVSPIEQVKQNIQIYSKEELEKYNPFRDKTLSPQEKKEANELKIQKLQEIADKEATTETTTTTEDGEVVTQGDALFFQMGVKPVEVVEEEPQKQEITFEGKRGQADSISFDNKTIKQGEEIELRDVNISQDDTMPDLRSGKYKVRMLSVDANGKTAMLTLTDGNEVITTTVKDLRNSKQSLFTKELNNLEDKKADIKRRRQEALKKFGTSEKQTSKNSVKVLGVDEYVSRELMELAYSNDSGNNPEIGGGGQTLNRIIERGGYSKEELSKLLKPEIDKINAKYDAELKALEEQSTSAKKADIEKLEKEKQEALQPLIEEKEQIEKEIEEIEKATDSREEKGKRNNIVPISTKEAERLLKHLSKKYGILGVLTDLLPEFTYGKFTTEKILINKNTYYDEKGDITFESKGFVNKTTIYHEYLHPFVQILERVNPELYEKIYQDSLSSDIDVSHYIKDVRKEERVVRYLDKLSAQEKTPSLLQQFFDFLSDLFFKNKKSDYRTLQKLNTNTTVEELYNIFKNYGNLREGSEKVKEERFLKLEATQLENLINLNAGDVESHKTELEIIKQKLDLLNRYDVDKLQQLKQKLAEVNKKINEVTKRFDAQIAQKQSELKALEQPTEVGEILETVISTEDLISLAASKYNTTTDTIIRNKRLQSVSKRLTGEKYISKLNEEQRKKLEKYLLSLKSRKEQKEEKLQETEEQRAKNKELVKNAALQFKIGSTTAIWNTNTQSFEFYNPKFDKKEANLNSVALSFSQKPNILNTWWDSLLSNKAKDEIVEAKNTLFDLFYKTNGIVDVEPQETPEIFLLKTLKGATFSLSDKKDLTDVSDKWFKEGERTISDLVTDLINDPIASEGMLANLDEQEIEQAIKDIISEYPDGITKKDIEKAIYENDTNSNDVLELEEEIALKFGVDIQTVIIKLGDQINEYEEKRRIEKETQEENLSKGTSNDREDVQQTEEVIPQEVSNVKPQTAEKAEKEQEKEVVEKFTEPANPFKNGKVKTSNWNTAISKITDLTLPNYRVKVINTSSLTFEQLPFQTKKYFEDQAAKQKTTVEDVMSKDKGKMLVLTDKEGNYILEEGLPVVTNFPDGLLAEYKAQYERQGLSEEQYNSKINQIKEARKNNSTLLIDRISNFPVEVVQDTNELSVAVGTDDFSIARGSKGFPVAMLGNQEVSLISRKLNNTEIDSILYILFKRWSTSGSMKNKKSDKYQKAQYVQKLILTGTGVGKINFKANEDYKTWTITLKQPDNSWKIATEQEVRDFLKNQYINVDINLSKENTPFTTYKIEDGKTVVDRVYPTYKDFLKDTIKTKGVSATKMQDNFYIEVGDTDGTLSAKLEEAREEKATEPVVEVVKPTTNTEIVEESEAVKEVKSVLEGKKKKNLDTPTDKDNFAGLLRSKKLPQEVIAEQNRKAKEWFDKSPLSKHISLNQLQNIVNSDAFASWNWGAITLFKGSQYTDLYHEAWHEFSQLYLTQKQKKALYEEIKKSNITIELINGKKIKSSEATNEQIEEYVAEDFRNYAKSNGTLILNNKFQRNSTFRKIWNFLKELFTKTTDLQTVYERLYTGNLSKYKRNTNNAFWGNLNLGIQLKNNKQLSDTDTKNLYRAIDSLVGTIFQQNGKPVTMMFADNKVLATVYGAIYKRLATEYNDLYDSIEERTTKNLSQGEAEQLKADAQLLDNLDVIIENWNEIVKTHRQYSAFFNISKDKIAFDEEGNITSVDDLFTEETDEGNSRNSEVIKNENVFSKEMASNETIFTIATLRRYNSDGTVATNPFLPFVADIVDFNNTWDKLTTSVNNTLNYDQLIDKITELGEKDKSFKDLQDRLPDPNKTLSDDEQRMKGAFMNDISKPLVNVYELVMKPLNGKMLYSYNTAASSDVDKVKKQWNDNFESGSPFIKQHPDDSLYTDIAEIKATYSARGTKPAFYYNKADYNKADKTQMFENRIDFLSNMGIKFTEDLLSDIDFKDFIIQDFVKTDYVRNSPAFAMYDLITNAKEDISSLSQLSKVKPSSNEFKYYAPTIEALANYEVLGSNSLFAQSVKNAANNSVWQIRQWNYITKIFNALNDVQKYPTYQDLIKEDWLKQFDFEANPYVKGIYLNTLFDLNPESATYGQRRVIKKGKQTIYPTISLHDYNGMRLNASEGKANEGKQTTGLTAFEKIVQNINSLLLFNTQENLRYGDKSSSYSTMISHYLTANGKLEDAKDRKSIISFSKFTNGGIAEVLPTEAYKILVSNLKQEVIPMIRFKNDNVGVNLRHYNKNIKDFGTFNNILTKDTKDKIQKQIIDANVQDEKEISKILLSLPLREEFEIYIATKSEQLSELLDTDGLLDDLDLFDPKLVQATVKNEEGQTVPVNLPKQSIYYAYIVNSLLYNMEHTKLISFDPRFYKTANDVIKRLSAWSATGNMFIVDAQTNEFIRSKGNAIKDAIAKKLKTKISDVAPDGSIRSVIFTDNKYSAEKLLEIYKEKFLATGKYTAEQLNTILKAYTKIEEGDGQGYVTLDLLRQSKLRAGSSHWTKEHEAAYQKEAKFINGESTEGMSLEEMTLFTVQKWQYAGIGLENGIPYPTFYKFSVVPLIPSAIEKTNFKAIHENLIKQNVGLGLFESGSKASSNQEVELNPDGSIKLDKNGNPITKSNPFYSDYSKRKPFEGEYTINNIFFQYLKEQVNIEPKLKGETMFSTQMRKLLHLNLYNNGVPNDVKLSVKEWNKLSKTQKIAQSDVYKQEQKFGEVIEKLVEIERNSLLKKMGATQQADGNYKIDAEKLSDFFREEFIKRDLPNEVVNYLQAENGEFKFPIDAFKQRATIERIAYSIANKKLVQQKMTGEALIQVASTGFELTDKFSEVREDNDLPFYTEPGKAQKVKIALTERWKPLLNLDYKGAKIETIDRLNEAIKDEEWLEKNRKVITIVGVRIPVQGLNSQEYMEVFHFLPESMGAVIIVSPALVAKSGGDFDVDKLTTFFPNFTKNGKLNTFASKEEVQSLKKQVQTLTRKFENISKDIETTDVVQENLTEEIETYLFNLFEEDDDIVLEAKKQLKNIEKTLSKLEGKSAKIWNEIQELQAEIEQKGSPKKAYENELIDLIRETLSRAENFQQLVRPNDTDLLNNTEYGSEKLKNLFPKPYQDNTFTSVVDFASILEKFKSNLVGKSNLGIAAVNNVFFALAQRAGLRHNKTYSYRDFSGKFKTKDVEFYLPHNTIEEDGEQFVSLSGLNSKNSENYISDIISQYINGFVDVANDDWIFFINAVKEFAPTMLYTAMAGTNAKTTIAFFNQPIMRDYIKKIDKYKNIFTKFKDPQSFQLGNWKALEEAAMNLVWNDKTLSEIAEQAIASTRPDRTPQPFLAIRKHILETVKPTFLTEKRLSEALYEDKPLSAEEQIFAILHFWELRGQSGIVTNLQRSLNSDTKKVGTGYSSKERQLLFEDVEKSGLFNTDAMYRMRNESTVRAFTNDKTGFDTFSQQLFTDVFEVTNHPTFSEIIRELIKNDTQLKFEYKFSELEKLVNTIKNDFITYLYQNQVLDGNDNLFKKMQPLFNPKSSMALELKNLKEKYPNLENQFPILGQLIPDNYKIGNKVLKTNLKLKKALADKDELNNATRQMRELIQFSSNSYTPEQQIEIQQFTDRLIKFIIVQSGLNPSVYNLLDLVPNEYYTQNIKHIIKDVQKALDKDVNKDFSLKKENKSGSQKNLEIFYNRFKIERPTFFNLKEDEEGELPNVNKINQRGVNYYLPKTDITGAKAQEAEDKLLSYIPTLPSKSITTDKTNAQVIKRNPKSLAVVYDNLQLSNTEALKSGKVVNFATMTAKNKETIDRQIDEIISKSMGYETISFDTTKGYFQDIRESNPELFNYGSQRLKDTFGITNPNFEEIKVTGIIASEKTIRDLAARISDRIGIPVRFESDRTKEYKGKIENGTAVY